MVEKLYYTFEEVSAVTGIVKKTLHNYVHLSKLGEFEGLRKFGTSSLVEWEVFKRALDAGVFAKRRANHGSTKRQRVVERNLPVQRQATS